jgi:hypothetical protein
VETFKIFGLLATLLAAVVASVALAGGNEGSGGADLVPGEDGSVWFMGGAPISYCVEIAPGYPFSRAVIEEKLASAFMAWERYIEVKKINFGMKAEDRILLTRKRQPKCTPAVDLRFYFGVDNPEVRKAKGSFYNPVAFAHRTHYDIQKTWGNGFIWISSPKSFNTGNATAENLEDELRALLMHEIGHVLGNSHVNFTIMDESQFGWSHPYAKHAKIDWAAELYTCYSCPYEGTLGKDEADGAQQFERLTGRKPVGAVRAQVVPDPSGLKLVVQDDQGSTQMGFEMESDETSSSSVAQINLAIFKRAWPSQYGGAFSPKNQLNSSVGFADLVEPSGAKSPVTIDFNTQTAGMNGGPLVIYYLKGSKRELLFHAALKY